jgi:branched-chain amino acid transport system ATP-binding protein
MSGALLKLDDVHTYLGDSHIIQGVSFDVPAGKVVALLGRNGAGKTTTLRSIMRMVQPRRGRITFEETRAIFPSLSVEENIAIATRPGRESNGWTMERIYEDFPNLAQRRNNGGTQLSGGEQQMLAMARALVANPRIMLLDEPSEGLAPLIVRQIADIIMKLKQAGMTMLLVEQNFAMATAVADHVIVLGKGRVRWSGTSEELRKADEIRHTWLGV